MRFTCRASDPALREGGGALLAGAGHACGGEAVVGQGADDAVGSGRADWLRHGLGLEPAAWQRGGLSIGVLSGQRMCRCSRLGFLFLAVDGGFLHGRRSADAALPESALGPRRRPFSASGICRAARGREARKFGAACDLGAEADASSLSDGNGLLDERCSGCPQAAAGLLLCPWARRKVCTRRWQPALSAAPAAPGTLALRRSEPQTKVIWQPLWTTRTCSSPSPSGRSFTTAAAALRMASPHDRHVVLARHVPAPPLSHAVVLDVAKSLRWSLSVGLPCSAGQFPLQDSGDSLRGSAGEISPGFGRCRCFRSL